MGWLTGLPLKMYLYAGIALVIAGLALGLKVQTSRLATSKAETVAVQGRFDAFVSQAKALGDAQNAKAKAEDIINQKRVEDAKDENAKTKSALTVALNSLRSATPDPHSRELPKAPGTSSRPDLICLDRVIYQRENGDALARLFEGARSLADEGSAATVDLNTAKRWANPPP